MPIITGPSSRGFFDRASGRLTVRPWGHAFIAVAAVLAVATTAVPSLATADSGAVQVKGAVKNISYSGGDCASPVPLCFKGAFRGSLHGPDEGTVNSIAPTSEPGVVFGDATLKIHDQQGDLTCRELFVYDTSPASEGPVSWLCEITTGTGRYAGASGYLQGIGQASPSTGVTRGTYHGVITLR
jgi:hypothetical protein